MTFEEIKKKLETKYYLGDCREDIARIVYDYQQVRVREAIDKTCDKKTIAILFDKLGIAEK
jgi:hypothetical protein